MPRPKPRNRAPPIVNPIAMILSAAMLLDHVGEHEKSERVRAAIAAVLERELTYQLERKGYVVAAAGAKTASARLNIDIAYIWDGRLYDEDLPPERLYPELRLYAEVTLTDLASGKAVLRKEVQGSGLINSVLSPAPEARYTAPQRDLARRTGRLLPAIR